MSKVGVQSNGEENNTSSYRGHGWGMFRGFNIGDGRGCFDRGEGGDGYNYVYYATPPFPSIVQRNQYLHKQLNW
jgi:hypothetical protein